MHADGSQQYHMQAQVLHAAPLSRATCNSNANSKASPDIGDKHRVAPCRRARRLPWLGKKLRVASLVSANMTFQTSERGRKSSKTHPHPCCVHTAFITVAAQQHPFCKTKTLYHMGVSKSPLGAEGCCALHKIGTEVLHSSIAGPE